MYMFDLFLSFNFPRGLIKHQSIGKMIVQQVYIEFSLILFKNFNLSCQKIMRFIYGYGRISFDIDIFVIRDYNNQRHSVVAVLL